MSRTPQSPQRLALLGGLWLATAGEWRLWDTLARLSTLGDAGVPGFIGSAMLLLAAVYTLALSVLAWPRLIRPALSLALLGLAWSAMQAAPRPLDMPAPTLALLLAGGPLLWLWSQPVAHMADTWAQLLHNLGLVMGAAGLAAAVLILNVADFSWMWLQHGDLLDTLQPARLWQGWLDVQNGLFLHTSHSIRAI
jgi:glucan phosphoethanolaminetransferase (alkaline phosphatase superfamily)